MGMVRKETFEDVTIDADPDRFFKAWMDMPVLIPQLFTENVEKSCCYKGDHHVAGGAVEMIYPPGQALFTKTYTSGRDVFTHTLVDYDKRVHKYDWTEGELKDRCNFHRGHLVVVPHESGTKSVVKHDVEFQLLDDADTTVSTDMQERAALQYFFKLENYLKANPTEYTT